MQDTARLSGHAAAQIALLEADGIRPTAEEIVRINALGWEIHSPAQRLALSRGAPVIISGIPLWPLTCHAQDWYRRIGSQLLTHELREIALAYAAAHCYVGADTLDTMDITGAEAAVTAWVSKLRVRQDVISEALTQLIQQDESFDGPPIPAGMRGDATGPGEIALTLASRTGIPAREYERMMSVSAVVATAEYVAMQQDRAEGRAQSQGPRAEAQKAMGYYILQIRESREAENGA